jgi:GT2 family glycosyltransferase
LTERTNTRRKTNPKVVVLILSYNGKYLLEEAISSYLENDYPNFKVIVIDNGSRDGTLEFVKTRFPNVEVLRTEKNLGYSGGLNLGLEYVFNGSNADYALVTNNDVRIDKKAISALVEVAETDEKIGFVTGKVYYYDCPATLQTVGKKEDFIRWNGDHIGQGEEDKGQHDDICERCFVDDIYTLVSGYLYRHIGGYNPSFFLQGEEYDWQARAKKLGYRIMYTPHAKLWHKESMTIGRVSALKAYYDARNPMLVILLHRSHQFFRRFFWSYFWADVLRSSLVAVKQGNVTKALAKWQGLLSALAWGAKNRKLTLKHFI